MQVLKCAALAAAATLIASTASAVELNYRWKRGDVHRFAYRETTNFTMSGPGMNIQTTMEVGSHFDLKVLRTRPNGKADVRLNVRRLDIYQDGAKAGAITEFPPAARSIRAEIDRKGRVKFYELVKVYRIENRMYVGITNATASRNGASMSSTARTADGEEVQVDVFASFDPQTGRLSAGSTFKKKKAERKKVAQMVRQERPHVDALPRQIFEMMVMPEGSMTAGSEQKIKHPFGGIAIRMDALEGPVATLGVRSVTVAKTGANAKGEAVVAGADDAEAGAFAGGLDVSSMMAGVPGMGGQGGLPGGPSATVDTKMNTKAKARFDTKKGRLLDISGRNSMTVSMGGMGNMKTDTDFSLTRR